jgi:hypothetical protein
MVIITKWTVSVLISMMGHHPEINKILRKIAVNLFSGAFNHWFMHVVVGTLTVACLVVIR